MNVFRDCASGGAPFDSTTPNIPGTISIFDENLDEIENIILDAPSVSVVDLPIGINLCPANNQFCKEIGVYIFQTALPEGESFTFTYQRCCRNQSVSNIFSSEETGFTLTIDLSEEASMLCNSSPRFNKDTPIAFCVNQALNFDLSAIDEEGDELRYSLCVPLIGGGLAGTGGVGSGNVTDLDGVTPDPDAPPPYNSVSLIQPNFSEIFPLGNSITIDENTGLLTGVPNFTGKFTFGLCMEEIRNGQLLSVVTKDIQVDIAECKSATGECTVVNTKELELSQIAINPNPIKDFVVINSPVINFSSCKIIDLNGKTVFSQSGLFTRDMTLNISHLVNSIYIIECKNQNGATYRQKIVKQ